MPSSAAVYSVRSKPLPRVSEEFQPNDIFEVTQADVNAVLEVWRHGSCDWRPAAEGSVLSWLRFKLHDCSCHYKTTKSFAISVDKMKMIIFFSYLGFLRQGVLEMLYKFCCIFFLQASLVVSAKMKLFQIDSGFCAIFCVF